jgi:hypothetical protein
MQLSKILLDEKVYVKALTEAPVKITIREDYDLLVRNAARLVHATKLSLNDCMVV